MAVENVVEALEGMKEVISHNEELLAIARAAETPKDLERLWTSAKFREVHDRWVEGLDPEDVKAYVGELREDQLEQVAGGFNLRGSTPKLNLMSPREIYVGALYKVLIGL